MDKNPKKRVRDIGDALLVMEGAFETTVPQPTEAAVAPPLRVWQRPVPLVLAVVGLMAVSSLAVWTLTRPESAPSLKRLTIVPPDATPLPLQATAGILAISPDGAHVIYASGTGQTGTGQLNLDLIRFGGQVSYAGAGCLS